MEHVGVGFDWNLGYREEADLSYWKKFDLETNPELWGFSQKDIKEINTRVQENVDFIISKAYKQKDSEANSILFESHILPVSLNVGFLICLNRVAFSIHFPPSYREDCVLSKLCAALPSHEGTVRVCQGREPRGQER